jgi:hypothetical protein
LKNVAQRSGAVQKRSEALLSGAKHSGAKRSLAERGIAKPSAAKKALLSETTGATLVARKKEF